MAFAAAAPRPPTAAASHRVVASLNRLRAGLVKARGITWEASEEAARAYVIECGCYCYDVLDVDTGRVRTMVGVDMRKVRR